MEIMENIFNFGRENNYVIALGILTLAWLGLRLVKIILHCSVYFSSPKADFVKFADGGFALITGGAGGIGKAMAFELAQRGIKLYLIDFNGKLLDQTVAELSAKYPELEIKSKTMDLTQLTIKSNYENFKKEIDSMKIGILFNCAGIAEYKVFRYCSNKHEELVSMTDLNCTIPGLLYHSVLPQMIQRKNGLMLIMASASSLSCQPLVPYYGSTKAFALQLSKSLQVLQVPLTYNFT